MSHASQVSGASAMEALPTLSPLVIRQLLLRGLFLRNLLLVVILSNDTKSLHSCRHADTCCCFRGNSLCTKDHSMCAKTDCVLMQAFSSSGPRPARATSGAPAKKPRNNKIRTPHSICACGRLHKHSPHTTRHTMNTQNLHTAGSFRMRARTQTNTTHNKTHNAHTRTCTPQGVSACARAPRQTPHASRHTMHMQKLAHRREFPHARAHGNTQETHIAHAKTCTPRSKYACMRTQRRLTRTKETRKKGGAPH